MTTQHYCYHCMRYHPASEMRAQHGPKGLRWRCLRSIEAARASTPERDAFGQRQSEENRLKSRHLLLGLHRERQQIALCA